MVNQTTKDRNVPNIRSTRALSTSSHIRTVMKKGLLQYLNTHRKHKLTNSLTRDYLNKLFNVPNYSMPNLMFSIIQSIPINVTKSYFTSHCIQISYQRKI